MPGGVLRLTVLRLTLGDGIPGLAAAQRSLAGFLEAAGCDPWTLFRAELVVEEVAMNVLHHGQPTDRPARAGLEAWLAEDRLVIAMEDDGPAFDPLQVVSAPLATRLEDARVGGIGLRLVRKNAAALRYARTPAGCNRLEIEILRAG